MKVAIRVDASKQIGTGHFVRCLALADALRQQGNEIQFVCRHMQGNMTDMIFAHGHGFVILQYAPDDRGTDNLHHSFWLGTSQSVDAHETLHVLSDKKYDWLIVDHYALDSKWELTLRPAAEMLFVIDDLADRRHNCDLLLDQNYFAEMATRYSGKVPETCQLLLGPKYALLRDEFQQRHKHIVFRAGLVKRILVFFGGIDAKNLTLLTIESLVIINSMNIHVDVVIGRQHPSIVKIESLCFRYGFTCHVQTDQMAELMANADLAIGAGGTAIWERCCMALPSLVIALAQNQIVVSRELDRYGACIYLGSSDAVSQQEILHAIADILNNDDHLKKLSQKSYSLVDGKGVKRVCQELSKVQLRNLSLESTTNFL